MRTTLLLSALLTSSIFFSGCTGMTSELKPATEVNAQFKNSIDKKITYEAVVAAAKQTAWSITSDQNDNSDLILSKVYEKREAVSSHPAYRGQRKIVQQYIYTTVKISEQGFYIQLSDATGKIKENTVVKEVVNQDIKRLEEAIYLQLLPQVI